MRKLKLLTIILAVGLAGCTLFRPIPTVVFTPESGHASTMVTMEVAALGDGWSYRLEWPEGSKTQSDRTFKQTVYPPATMFVSGIHNDGRTTQRTEIEITLYNDPPVGYDPFGPLADFLVPGQIYVVDCNYHEWSAGFEWSPPVRAGFYDPEGDPWKITDVECWYELDGVRIDDPVFTPPLAPGEVQYHVGVPLVPVVGYRLENAFIIWPAVAKWAYVGGVPIPIMPLPGYSPPCDEYEMTGGYIPPGTIYHIDITVEDAYGDVTVLHVEKPLTGRAACAVT